MVNKRPRPTHKHTHAKSQEINFCAMRCGGVVEGDWIYNHN